MREESGFLADAHWGFHIAWWHCIGLQCHDRWDLFYPSWLCEIGLLPPLHLEHNFDFISCHVFFSMQALLSVLAVAWVAILWPLRKTTSYFLPCWLPWYGLQRFHLYQSLSWPTGLKILTVWRLFQPRSRKDVPVSKSTLVVMEFCDIHLCTNFQFLTWYLYVKKLEQIELTSPPPFLLSAGFLS
jgi:hypothetical protein